MPPTVPVESGAGARDARRSALRRAGPPALAAAVAIALPLVLGNSYWLHIVIYTLWFTYVCIAWNILAIGHQYSLMHTVFIGAGAYTSTLLFQGARISPWLGMLAGAAVALVLGLSVGAMCFRAKLPPLAFVLITLAMTNIAEFVAGSLPEIGGTDGIVIMIVRDDPANFVFVDKRVSYAIVLTMVVIALIVSRRVFASKLGLYLRAIYETERGAAAVGVNIFWYKMLSIGLSSALVAPAGTFWAQYSGHVEPASTLGVHASILIFLFVALGGVGTFWGPILGSLVLVPVGELIRFFLGAEVPGLNTAAYGVIVVLVVLFMPKGAVGWWRERRGARRSARVAAPTSA
jgi:branched-chain amino acid transport system permease protein